MRDCSVVIPTYNMGRFLEPLFRSIVESPLATELAEIIFSCEKSTDGSEEIIARLIESQKGRQPTVRMVQPAERKGVFMTRYHGALAATTNTLLFIDSRVTLPLRTARALPEIWRKHASFVLPLIDIDVKKNIYCLYWQRSHEGIFKKAYRDYKQITSITKDNFDQYLVGTTSVIVPRDLFLQECEPFLNNPLLSDDTFLLKNMIAKKPMTVHPEFRMAWEPRDRAGEFVKHLFKRGPGFAEYHIYERQGALFYAVMLGLMFSVAEFVLFFTDLKLALIFLGSGLLVLALSTALIVKSIGEFFRLAPLHVSVILAYGFGALRGIWIVGRLKLRRNRRVASPSA